MLLAQPTARGLIPGIPASELRRFPGELRNEWRSARRTHEAGVEPPYPLGFKEEVVKLVRYSEPRHRQFQVIRELGRVTLFKYVTRFRSFCLTRHFRLSRVERLQERGRRLFDYPRLLEG